MNNRREQEEKPSLGRRIMRVAAPIGAAAAVLARAHVTRARVPTGVKNPQTPTEKDRVSFFHPTPEPRFPKLVDPKNPRSTRWLTQSQIDGKSVVPKPGPLYEGPDLHENVGKPMAAAAAPSAAPKVAAPKVADVVPMPGAADKPVRTTEDARKTGRKILSDVDSGPSLKDIKAKHSTPPAPAKVKGQKVVDVNAERAAKLAERSKKKAVARAKSKIKEIKAGGKITEASAQRLNEILFNDANVDYGNLMGASDRVMTAYRKGRRMVPWIRRGSQVAEDVGDVASGKKPKDPFWNKTWAKSAVAGALMGAPILAARKINTWHHQDKKFPNSVHDTSPKLGRLKEIILKKARQADAKWVANGLKKGVKREPLLTNEGPLFASKIKNPVLLQAVLRKVEFARRDERDKKMSTGKKLAIVGGSLGLAAAASAPGIAAYRNMTKTGRELPKAMESLRRASQEVGDVARSIKESRNKTWLRRRLGFAAKVKNPVLLQAVLREVSFRADPEKKANTNKWALIGGATGVGTVAAAAALTKPKPRTQVGLLPFKGYKIPARVNTSKLPAGVAAAYVSPGNFRKDGYSDEVVTKAYGKRAMRGGAVFTNSGDANPAYSKVAIPLGYGSDKNLRRRALRHELIHSIRLQKQGKDPSTIPALVREEAAAYVGSNRSLKDLPQGPGSSFYRGMDVVDGTIGSTVHGVKRLGIRKLFSQPDNQTQFNTVDPLERGWDLRDARGRSARVYAPGSRKRQRREKQWDEKVDNIRAVRNAAIAGTVLASGGLAYAGWNGKQTRRKVMANYRRQITARGGPRKLPKTGPNVVPFKPGSEVLAAAKLRSIELADPAIRRLGDAVVNNVSLPEREPTTAEQAYAAIQKLPKKQRRGVLRILGAGTLAAGGVVAGKIAKRPILGSLVGGTAAGLTLG